MVEMVNVTEAMESRERLHQSFIGFLNGQLPGNVKHRYEYARSDVWTGTIPGSIDAHNIYEIMTVRKRFLFFTCMEQEDNLVARITSEPAMPAPFGADNGLEIKVYKKSALAYLKELAEKFERCPDFDGMKAKIIF